MTDESAAFVLGFSFIQLALAGSAAATISTPETVAIDLHFLQARQMLTYLRLGTNLAEMPADGLSQRRLQAEMIFDLLRPRSRTAAWSFRLGCDLGAFGTAQYQGVRSEQVEAFTNKFEQEYRESGVPFDLVRDVLWAGTDASLKRSDFVIRVSEAMNSIAEHLEGPDRRTRTMKTLQ